MTSPRTPRQLLGWTVPEHMHVISTSKGYHHLTCRHLVHVGGFPGRILSPHEEDLPTLVGLWFRDHAHAAPLSEVLPETPEPPRETCDASTAWSDGVTTSCQLSPGHEGEHRDDRADVVNPLKAELAQAREDLEEARGWAKHGYEIGQRSCTWSDQGVAPRWLIESYRSVPASQSAPAVPVSSTGGKETGEAAGTATEALRAEAIEAASESVHEQWMATKRAQGVSSRLSESGEELMVPYGQLSEAAKDLDRGSVAATVDALLDTGWRPPLPKAESASWQITVQVPAAVPVEQRQELFSRVAEVAHDWEPDDRDGWDVDVSGHPGEYLWVENQRLRTLIGDLDRKIAASSPLPDSETENAAVDEFCAERAQYVTALKQNTDGGADYHRWQGHAEARRQLSERLGREVTS